MSDEQATRTYNRPNLNWICTNAQGCGCPGGPTSDGRCPGKSQCTPIRQESSWKCSRSQVYGGACEIGPDPSGNCCTQNIGCVPKRNLRSKRRIFVISCVAVVTGILLLGIWAPNRKEFLAPGGLSANHAQIWSTGNNADRCVACHAAGAANPISWLVDAVSGGSHIGQPQYQKCLACHEDTLGTDHALLVHNVSKQTIADVSAEHAGIAASKYKLFASPVNHNGEIACAQCHQEHHGADHHLAAMTDTQCQSCHQSQFNSFESGHPEFETLLQGNRTKIAFDHFSHQSQHFSKANQSFDCKACHEGDQFDSVMQTKPFEQSCASCHNETIESSLSQGLPVFSLPVLDSSLLKRNGLDVGEWPELADGGFDGSIPPLMKVLLSSDPRAADAMKFLGAEFDLLDVDGSDTAQLKAAYQLALATKSLMFDLSANGQIGLADRLKKIAGDSVSQSKLRSMLGNLSADTFTQAQQQWFPNLGDEIDLIKINNNDIPLEIASKDVEPKKTFDVLLTTFVQQEKELALNPLKSLFVPENDQPLNQATIQPTIPESKPGTNIESAATQSETNSSSPLFNDLPSVGASPQAPNANQRGAYQSPLQKIKKIENKYYNSRKRIDAEQSGAANQNSNQLNPDVIVTRSGDSPAQEPETANNAASAETLTLNPLKGKMNSHVNDALKSESSPSTEIEKAFAINQGADPVIPSQLQIEPQKSSSQMADSNAQEIPTKEQGGIISTPSVPENELLADNPISKTFPSAESEATATDVVQKSDSSATGEAKPTDSKSLDKKPETNVLLSPNPEVVLAEPQITEPQIANSTAGDDADQKLRSNSEQVIKKLRREIERLPANQMVAMGGWYRDDATFTIAYRQAGHADPLTANWYEFVSSIPNSNASPMYSDFNKLMTKSTSPGLCSSCHSIDRQPDDSLAFHWKASYRDISTRHFTRFSHRPHLVQGKQDQCATCHQILPGSNVMNNYLASESKEPLFDAGGCEAGFAPMSKSNCVQCHNNRSKIQNCTQCHNYHVGSKVALLKK